jgi:uroporphyrinogen III methyltransferase/synthase
MASRIEAFGGTPVEYPAIEIREPERPELLAQALETPDRYDWIVFTSGHAVDSVAPMLGRGPLPRIAAVGSATARAAARLGLAVDLIPPPSRFRAEGLLEAFPEDLSGLRFLLPQGDLADPRLAGGLRARGATVEAVVAYRTAIPSGSAEDLETLLADDSLACVTFTSGSTVRHFWSMLRSSRARAALGRAPIAVIGPVTAQAVRDLGLEVAIQPDEATIPSLAEAIRAYLSREETGT